MRIHSDTLTVTDIYQAATAAGPAVRVEVTEHGSRSRVKAFRVTLTGTSSRRPNNGTGGRFRDGVETGGDYAATWDEWGIFLGELFRRDENATVPNVYENGEHFRWATCARFDDLDPAEQCSRSGHKWSYAVDVATGSYYVHQCQREDCDATERRANSREALAIIMGEV